MPPPLSSDARSREAALVCRRFTWFFFGTWLLGQSVAIYGFTRGWPGALREAAVAGGKVNVDAYVEWGEFWACAINAGLSGILALVFGKVAGRVRRKGMPAPQGSLAPDEPSPNVVVAARRHSPSRREWWVLLVILAAAGALRWVRMDLSFYNDEALTFRRCVAGHFRESGGKLKWRQVTWPETWWLNQNGNNSSPCSVLGRVCYEGWKKWTHAPNGAVSEAALRFPQWLAGMGSLVLLWLGARRVFGSEAGWLVLMLAAAHPWHVRYSTEARGYGLLLFGTAACFYCLVRGFEDARWRWWLGMGVAEALCLWAFPGALYFFGVVNVMVLAASLFLKWRQGGGWIRLTGPLVGMILGGMITLQLMLPTAPQLMDAVKSIPSLRGEMDQRWILNVVGGLLAGIRWVDDDVANPLNLALGRILLHHPWPWLLVALVSGSWLGGILLLVRRGAVPGIIALAGPLGLTVSWAVMRAQGTFMHAWYAIFVLPGLVWCAGSALAMLWKSVGAPGKGTALLAAGMTAVAWLGLDWQLASRSKEDLKGAARVIHQMAGRGPSATNGYLLAGVYTDVDVYAPEVRIISTVEELDAMIAEARKAGKRLYVTYGRKGLMELHKPDLLRRIDDRGAFQQLAVRYGQEEEQFTHWVFVLKTL